MSLFAIQADLENLFDSRGLSDRDQYAAKLAFRASTASPFSTAEVLKRISGIQTGFYKSNKTLSRKDFETELAGRISLRFKPEPLIFPTGLSSVRKKVETIERITIPTLLEEFRHSVESRSVTHFWESRSKGELRKGPESIAELAITQFFAAVVSIKKKGFVLRQLASGVGYVDIAVILTSVLHLIELKILTKNFTGIEQLEKYMIAEKRREGWLIIFDARKPRSRTPIPASVGTPTGLVRVIVVDINPVTPSSLSK